MQLILDTLVSNGYLPQGHTYSWDPLLIALHLGADLILAVALASIPLAVLWLFRTRNDVHRPLGVGLFATFIAAAALSHLVSIAAIWLPVHHFHGGVKLFSALAAGAAAVLAWRLLPTLIRAEAPARLHARNDALKDEIARRTQAERNLRNVQDELMQLNRLLETRIDERTADLKHANEELERFAYVASHDLRAPLRALMTVPDWIRESLTQQHGSVSPAVEVDLEEMELQSRRMDQLLSDLLTYSRIGNTPDQIQDLDAEALIRESAKLAGLPAGFTVEVAEDIPPVHANPTEFNLVMRNLISNAVKHHDRTEGTIRIDGETTAKGTAIRVADDGPGIPEKFSETVFDMFATLRPRDEVEGSGMGLAMVKKIMDRAGGLVSLAAPGGPRGTTFQLCFPPRTLGEKGDAT